MGQQIIITVLGLMVVVGIVISTTNDSILRATDTSVNYYNQTQSRNLSYSAAQIMMIRIAENPDYRILNDQTEEILGGKISYSVKTTMWGTDTVLVISAKGIFQNDTTVSTIHVEKTASSAPPEIPEAVRATISMGSEVEVGGNMTVDGRDHDLNGNLIIGGGGQHGVWSTSEVKRKGNAKIGGFDGTTSYAPSKSPDPNSYKENAPSSNVPKNPDDVFGGTKGGYPPGKLKSIAKSGADGSQYVTDPSKLKYPLQGVTYVDLGGDGSWKPKSIDGSGILIVRNDDGDAKMENVNKGTFTGIVVADQIEHFHASIVGAVVTLGKDGGKIGEGNGEILYSSAAVKKSTNMANEEVVSGGGNLGGGEVTKNFGFAKTRLFVRNWYE